MMDAVKFIKERNRMCKSFGWRCNDCPADKNTCCDAFEWQEDLVTIVEEWSAAHPRKTRQSVFLNLFPDADISTGTVNVCPNSLYAGKCNCARYKNCLSCKREFWSQEVD